MHHFVLHQPRRTDTVCPGGLQASLGERFFAAGNERSQMHLPSPYGYYNSTQANWRMIYHLVNKARGGEEHQHRDRLPVPHRRRRAEAQPLWLDIDGCGGLRVHDSDRLLRHARRLDSTVSGRMIGMNGHLHDIDITNPAPCPEPLSRAGSRYRGRRPRSWAATPNDYFGPIPPNNSPPPHLTGATLCRSEGYLRHRLGDRHAGPYRGHLDTMSQCGIISRPAGRPSRREACPAGGAYSFEGYPVKPGQVIRLHSEYQNNTGAAQTDVMGIMMAWLRPPNPGYPRPKGATPMRASLVPAYNQCTSPNRVHGPPDIPGGTNPDGSCNPPTQTSGQITVGSPDAAAGQRRTRSGS